MVDIKGFSFGRCFRVMMFCCFFQLLFHFFGFRLLCVFPSALLCCNCQHLCLAVAPTLLRICAVPLLPFCVTSLLVCRSCLYHSCPFLQNINLSFDLCSSTPPVYFLMFLVFKVYFCYVFSTVTTCVGGS